MILSKGKQSIIGFWSKGANFVTNTSCCVAQFFKLQSVFILPSKAKDTSPEQTDATLLANNSQHCWMFHVAFVCTSCCLLLRVVGSCCAKFETGQTFSYVQKDTTTPNNAGPTLLGVVGSCSPTMLRPFALVFTLVIDG